MLNMKVERHRYEILKFLEKQKCPDSFTDIDDVKG